MRRKGLIFLLCLLLMLLLPQALAVSGADENEWTITLDFNDGVSRNGAIFVEKSASVDLPTTPERPGYSFAGWTTEDGTSVNAAGFTPEGDVTLVAMWEVGKNKVSFLDSDGGAVLDEAEYEYGSTLTELPEPTKDGFTFRYWSLSENGERADLSDYVLTGDVTLYAVWMEEGEEEFQVVFKASQFSTDLTEDKILYVVKGSSVKKGDAVKSLEREGYKFEGWTAEEPENGDSWTIDTFPAKNKPKTQKIPFKPKADTTLYPLWTIQQYMAIFNANYTDSPYENGVVSSSDLLSSETVTEPEEVPEREGYVFEGWYNKAVGGEPVDFSSGIVLSSNTGFYAHWKNAGVQTDTFHAEYTPFDPDQKYYGYSGSVQGANCIVKDAGAVGTVLKDDYPVNSKLTAGNGYYVSYQYERGDTLSFVINSSKATTAKLYANLAVEVDTMDVGSTGENATAIRVNGQDIEYSLTLLRMFQEYEIAEIELQEGENVIEFVVDNDNTVMGGTYRAVGFMTDYIRLADTDASFTWSPIYDNLEII